MSKNYKNKLVRDNIPNMIAESGRTIQYKKIENKEKLLQFLRLKLIEESNEYAQNKDITELADILEVIYAILNLIDFTFNDLEKIRIEKKQIRGGFDHGYILQ